MSPRRGCAPMRGRIGRYGCDWRVRCGQWEHSEGRRRDTLGTRSRPEQPRENPEQPEHPEAPRYAVLAGSKRRRLCALAAASPRLATLSLPKMLDTWTLAVLGEMNSSPAISRLLRPAATRRSTSSSRSVSPSPSPNSPEPEPDPEPKPEPSAP